MKKKQEDKSATATILLDGDTGCIEELLNHLPSGITLKGLEWHAEGNPRSIDEDLTKEERTARNYDITLFSKHYNAAMPNKKGMVYLNINNLFAMRDGCLTYSIIVGGNELWTESDGKVAEDGNICFVEGMSMDFITLSNVVKEKMVKFRLTPEEYSIATCIYDVRIRRAVLLKKQNSGILTQDEAEELSCCQNTLAESDWLESQE